MGGGSEGVQELFSIDMFSEKRKKPWKAHQNLQRHRGKKKKREEFKPRKMRKKEQKPGEEGQRQRAKQTLAE